MGFPDNWENNNVCCRALGAFDRLRLDKDRGVNIVELHFDSIIVNRNLKGGELGCNTYGWNLVKQIHWLMHDGLDVHLCHVDREANKCVDVLINFGCDHEPKLVIYEHLPYDVMIFSVQFPCSFLFVWLRPLYPTKINKRCDPCIEYNYSLTLNSVSSTTRILLGKEKYQ